MSATGSIAKLAAEESRGEAPDDAFETYMDIAFTPCSQLVMFYSHLIDGGRRTLAAEGHSLDERCLLCTCDYCGMRIHRSNFCPGA